MKTNLAVITVGFFLALRSITMADNAEEKIVLDYHKRTSDCTAFSVNEMEELGLIRRQLAADTTLYAVPCTRHAYNVTFRLYVQSTENIQNLRTLYFATFSKNLNWGGTDILFNVSISGKQLSAFYKGRGLGDCGTFGEWTWQSHSYKLERFASQETCTGVSPKNWPVIFSADYDRNN